MKKRPLAQKSDREVSVDQASKCSSTSRLAFYLDLTSTFLEPTPHAVSLIFATQLLSPTHWLGNTQTRTPLFRLVQMHSGNGDVRDSSTSMGVQAWVLDTISVFGPEFVPTNVHVCFSMLQVSYSKCKLSRLISMYVSILSDNTSSASNIVLRFPLFRSFWGIYNQQQPQPREINIRMSFLICRFTSLRQRLRWMTIQSVLHKMGGSDPERETQSLVCTSYIAPSLFRVSLWLVSVWQHW